MNEKCASKQYVTKFAPLAFDKLHHCHKLSLYKCTGLAVVGTYCYITSGNADRLEANRRFDDFDDFSPTSHSPFHPFSPFAPTFSFFLYFHLTFPFLVTLPFCGIDYSHHPHAWLPGRSPLSINNSIMNLFNAHFVYQTVVSCFTNRPIVK